MQSIFLSLGLMLMISSCEKNLQPVASPEKTIENVSYGSDPRQKMDIYLPANRNTSDTKLLILIHGGSWSGGDKIDFNPFIDELQNRLPDYAFANINYRLFNNTSNKFPTQETDVRSAVDFLIKNSAGYGISKKIVLLGASAGAHLALLQAYKYANDIPCAAVVSFFGPTDLVELYSNPVDGNIRFLLQSLLEGTPEQNNNIYTQSSPITFVNTSTPPTLLLHGSRDNVVSTNQSINLKNKLESAGVSNQLIIYPNEGHGWIGSNLTDSFIKIVAFLSLYVK